MLYRTRQLSTGAQQHTDARRAAQRVDNFLGFASALRGMLESSGNIVDGLINVNRLAHSAVAGRCRGVRSSASPGSRSARLNCIS